MIGFAQIALAIVAAFLALGIASAVIVARRQPTDDLYAAPFGDRPHVSPFTASAGPATRVEAGGDRFPHPSTVIAARTLSAGVRHDR